MVAPRREPRAPKLYSTLCRGGFLRYVSVCLRTRVVPCEDLHIDLDVPCVRPALYCLALLRVARRGCRTTSLAVESYTSRARGGRVRVYANGAAKLYK